MTAACYVAMVAGQRYQNSSGRLGLANWQVLHRGHLHARVSTLGRPGTSRGGSPTNVRWRF
jgi:hypothetical protein